MNNSEIVNYLFKNYKNLGNIYKINKIRHNNINSQNYLIRTSKDNFILRQYSNQYSCETIKKICEILNYCYQKNLNVPKPIKRINETFVNSIDNIYLTKFYDGGFFNGSIQQSKNLAMSIANLHKILKTFPHNYRFNSKIDYNLLSIYELNKILKLIHKNDHLEKYDNLIVENIDFLKSSFSEHFDKKLFRYKKQLIHNDLHPKNIIFLKNSKSVILDFNSVKQGLVIEDVSFASFRFAIFNSSKISSIHSFMKSFLTIYNQHNLIDDIHNKNLIFYIRIRLLSLISYILREKYFQNSDLWLSYLSKHLKSLKILEKLPTIQI